MKGRAKQYLLSLGYSEAEVEEALANATEEDLKGLVPEVEVPKVKPKLKTKPKTTSANGTHKQVTPVPAQVFDPIKEAASVIEGEKEEKKNQVIYTVTPVWKLTICSDVEKITFNAIKEELKSIGGKWSDEINGFWFDVDPSNIL